MGEIGSLACIITLTVCLSSIAVSFAETATAASNNNPLLVSGLQFPLWDQIKPKHVRPAVKQLIAEEMASLELLEQDLSRALAAGNITFTKLFGPFTQIRLRLDSVYGQIDHLSSVMNSDELRSAVEATAPERVALELRLGQSKPVYEAVKYLNNTPSVVNQLSAEEQRLVQITLEDAMDSGVGLSPDKKKRFNDIVDTLQKLSLNYSNNVLDATKAWKLVITDKKKLAGIEQTTLAVAAQKAQKEGFRNATAELGPWVITPDYATYASVVGFARDRGLRQQVYTAYRSLASSGNTDNTPLIRKILTLRRELAQLLGYPNYAVSAMKGRMANLTSATALLEQVIKASRPAAIQEDQQLTAFARNATGDPNLTLLWWDIAYWAERQKEALFKVKQEELRDFLPLGNVLQGMFGLAKKLYGVDVELVNNSPPVWHKDVKVFALKDSNSGRLMGYLYTDCYARPGQKEGGAWVQPFWDSARYYRAPSPAALALQAAAIAKPAKANQTVSVQWTPKLAQQTQAWLALAPKQIPLAILVSNQDPPADGKPSLMTMDQAETVFHEFGHALQHLLTQASQGLMSGMRNIEWDAVETPSQMQEKWVYDKKTFDSFAKHWKTGQPVPEWMYEQIKGTIKYRKGNAFTWQLVLGVTDLILHSTYDPQGKESPVQVQQEQYKRIMPYPPNPEDAQLNNFGHIFGGGYAAGYYSYMWADVMSSDAFEAFVEAGIDNEGADHRLGRKFRDTFLASGGAVPPGAVFKQFRGRDPKVEPMLIYNGLA
jgi:oligopeptidase A